MSGFIKNFLDNNSINEKKIAIGVSGGCDSLALALMAAEELTPLGYKIIALTVDHQLRLTSAQEALYVKKVMTAHQIEHHSLLWLGEKPQTGIEEAARKARYSLIANWCKENNVASVMMAHHLQDQVETFFIRLHRGSGLDGLCGMQDVFCHHNLKILRPLLDIDKSQLENYLQQKNISWVNDESNACDDLLRVRIRKFLPDFYQKTGIDALLIAETMSRLQSSKSLIENMVQNTLNDDFTDWKAGYSIALEKWDRLDFELKFRLMALLLKELGNLEYTPRADSICRLLQNIENQKFKSATLGRCEIISFNQQLWIAPEAQNCSAHSKQEWADFVEKHSALKKQKLPHKMRVALLNHHNRHVR